MLEQRIKKLSWLAIQIFEWKNFQGEPQRVSSGYSEQDSEVRMKWVEISKRDQWIGKGVKGPHYVEPPQT